MKEPEKTPVPTINISDISSPIDQARWLLERIDRALNYIQTKRTHFQKWSGRMRVISLVLSGLVTISLGIRWDEYQEELRNFAFVLGAIVSIITSVDLYYNFRGLWIEHEEAKWRLSRLKDRIEFYLSGTPEDNVNVDTILEYHESYQWIWDNLSSNWISLRHSTAV